MWNSTLLVQNGQIAESAGLAYVRWRVPPAPAWAGPPAYLVQVEARDWFNRPVAYTALRITRCWRSGNQGWMDPSERTATLPAADAALVRAWLQQRSPRAWTQAAPTVHAVL